MPFVDTNNSAYIVYTPSKPVNACSRTRLDVSKDDGQISSPQFKADSFVSTIRMKRLGQMTPATPVHDLLLRSLTSQLMRTLACGGETPYQL